MNFKKKLIYVLVFLGVCSMLIGSIFGYIVYFKKTSDHTFMSVAAFSSRDTIENILSIVDEYVLEGNDQVLFVDNSEGHILYTHSSKERVKWKPDINMIVYVRNGKINGQKMFSYNVLDGTVTATNEYDTEILLKDMNPSSIIGVSADGRRLESIPTGNNGTEVKRGDMLVYDGNSWGVTQTDNHTHVTEERCDADVNRYTVINTSGSVRPKKGDNEYAVITTEKDITLYIEDPDLDMYGSQVLFEISGGHDVHLQFNENENISLVNNDIISLRVGTDGQWEV